MEIKKNTLHIFDGISPMQVSVPTVDHKDHTNQSNWDLGPHLFTIGFDP